MAPRSKARALPRCFGFVRFFGGELFMTLLNMFFLSVGWILGYAIFRQTGFPCFKIVGWLTLCVQQTCCARSGEKLQNFWRAAQGGPTDVINGSLKKVLRAWCNMLKHRLWPFSQQLSSHPNWKIDTTSPDESQATVQQLFLFVWWTSKVGVPEKSTRLAGFQIYRRPSSLLPKCQFL